MTEEIEISLKTVEAAKHGYTKTIFAIANLAGGPIFYTGYQRNATDAIEAIARAYCCYQQYSEKEK